MSTAAPARKSPGHNSERLRYVRDAIFGAIDGTVTTFAVVTGATGAELSGGVVLVLGLANLLADGFSMGVSNYLGTRAEAERVEQLRRAETAQLEHAPDAQRGEVRAIYAQHGFAGADLDRVVEVITADPARWVETLLRERHGVTSMPSGTIRTGLVTFAAFLTVGLLPLLPFVLQLSAPAVITQPVLWSGVLTAIAFGATGWVKAQLLGGRRGRSALETLMLGGAAAAIAFAVGVGLRDFT